MEAKVRVLRGVLGDFRVTGSERLFHCPACKHSKNKLSINIEKDKFQCWHCGYAGRSLYRIIRRFGSFLHQRKWREFIPDLDLSRFEEFLQGKEENEWEQVVDLPEDYVFLGNRDLPMSSLESRRYLAERGITMDDILFWKIGYCANGPYSRRIVIPSFNSNGDPNYFIARSYRGDWMKYKNPKVSKDVIFNELYVDFDEDLVLVEGVFDAIKAGENAVPILGSTLKEESRLFQGIVQNDTAVYMALDPDAEKKACTIIQKMLQYDVEVYKVDISGFGDVGEMTRGQFLERKRQATWVNPDKLFHMQVANI